MIDIKWHNGKPKFEDFDNCIYLVKTNYDEYIVAIRYCEHWYHLDEYESKIMGVVKWAVIE